MNGLIVYSAGYKTKNNLLRRLMKLAEGGLHGLMILSMQVPNLSALFVIASGEENLKGVPSVDVQMLKGTSELFGKPVTLAIPRKSLGISELAVGTMPTAAEGSRASCATGRGASTATTQVIWYKKSTYTTAKPCSHLDTLHRATSRKLIGHLLLPVALVRPAAFTLPAGGFHCS
jgi:hypothetical protein